MKDKPHHGGWASQPGDPEQTVPGSGSQWHPDERTLSASSPRPGPQPPWHKGQRIGNFVVDRPLGAGAMGVVLLAHDPELDRWVAIKVLAPGRSDTESQKRLLREAQVTARLNHPNVVSVHQVGTLGSSVYLVMEYVDGGSLGAWIRSAARPWPDIVAAYRQAGEGLAAAHAAGLVHRDFKPDNVLIGSDGRVRVTDFGLVGLQAHPIDLSEIPAEVENQDLTRTGAVLGTPAYMAPEQLSGQPLDARADQFAFCVSVFEALYGFRPFTGDTMANLVYAVTHGQIRQVPSSQVPGFVHAAVLRGLSTDPAERFADMHALLEALQTPQPKRRIGVYLGLGGAALAMVVGGVVGIGVFMKRQGDAAQAKAVAPDFCTDDIFEDRWNDATRTRLREAFAQSKRANIETLAGPVEKLLDDYATRVQTEVDARCPEPGSALVCLEDRRDALITLAELSIERGTDPRFVDGAVGGLTAALPDLRRCSSEDEFVLSPQITRARHRLIRARATFGSLGVDDAESEVIQLLPEIRELGDPSTLAQALVLQGDISSHRGDFEGAEAALREALEVAAGGRDHFGEAQAAIRLFATIGSDHRRTDEAKATADLAKAAVARARSPRLDARLHAQLAVAAHTAARFDDAITQYDAALAGYEGLENTELEASQVRSNRAASLHALGRFDDARAEYEAAIASLEHALGSHHPSLASAHVALGNLELAMGKLTESEGRFRTAVTLVESAYGDASPQLAQQLVGLAEVMLAGGRTDEARARYERALGILDDTGVDLGLAARANLRLGNLDHAEARFSDAHGRFVRSRDLFAQAVGPESLEVAQLELQLGAVAEAQDDLAGAKLHFERLIDIQEQVLGPKHATVSVSVAILGDNRELAGDCDQARLHYRRALTIRNDLGLRPDANLAQILAGLASCELSSGAIEAAQDTMKPAIELAAAKQIDGPLLGRVQFVAAKLRLEQGRSEDARSLSDEARAAFAAAGPSFATYVTEVDEWQREKFGRAGVPVNPG